MTIFFSLVNPLDDENVTFSINGNTQVTFIKNRAFTFDIFGKTLKINNEVPSVCDISTTKTLERNKIIKSNVTGYFKVLFTHNTTSQ